MKSKKKLGNPGNVGQLAGKSGKGLPSGKASSLQKLDNKTLGSALGLLSKHFK